MEHSPVAELAYWITEREAIRERKESGMAEPWSPDPAMRSPRYCNVRREDDKVTKWIAENWRNPNANSDNLTLAMTLARMVNWPDTLAEIGFPHEWSCGAYTDKIRDRAARYEKTWTSAYIVSTCGRSMPKEAYVCQMVCNDVYVHGLDGIIRECEYLEQAHHKLMMVDGLGSFLAAQIVADLKNTPGHPLQEARDWFMWCAPGPGSLRGLSWYFYGNPDSVNIVHANFKPLIERCFNEVATLLHPDLVTKLHMQDFQNCLCEFSKYMRVKNGDRRVRNKYRDW